MGTSPEQTRLALVTEVLRAFADATNDYPRLLETIAERTSQLLSLACSIRLFASDGRTLEFAALNDPRHTRESPLLRHADRPHVIEPESPFFDLMATERAFVFRTVPEEASAAGAYPERVDPRLAAAGVRDLLVAPMFARGERIGAIFVVRRSDDEPAFTDPDIELVQALAAHAALAISNARAVVQLSAEVAQRQRVEGSLALAEELGRFEKSIVDAVSQPLLVIDRDARIRSCNRAFKDLFRAEETPLSGASLYAIAGGVFDVPWIHQVVGKAQRDPTAAVAQTPELELQQRGVMRGCIVRGRRLSGNAGAVLLAFEDTTDRREAARAMERRALLVGSMSEAVVGTDLEQRIVEWNDAATRVFGWSAEEVLGRNAGEVFQTRGIDREGARRDTLAGATTRARAHIRHRDGHWLNVDFSSMPVRENGVVTGIVSVVQDVSARVRLEAEAKAQMRALEEAVDQLESFASSVSHDLRAPLRAIVGFARVLEEDHSHQLDEEGLRLLGVVRRNAGRMGQLIDDILDFARVGRCQVKRAQVDVRGLVRDAVAEATRLESGRDFAIDVGELPPAVADRALLAQVWQNLIGNAVKYTRGRTPARIDVTGEQVDGEVRYTVKDNGVGFDMRYVHKLFGVFERLHGTEFEGTGVGLALVERIVRRHGGRVWANAEVDRGATFHFAIPSVERGP